MKKIQYIGVKNSMNNHILSRGLLTNGLCQNTNLLYDKDMSMQR